MKHPVWLAILSAATLLGGCAAAPASLSIREVPLTGEEQALLELIGSEEDPVLYEYQADSQCRAVELRRYLLDPSDYHWEADGFSSSASEERGRLAFLPAAGGGCQLSLQSGSHTSRYTYPAWDVPEGAGEGCIRESELAIIYGQELPLLVQVQSSTGSHSIYTPQFSWEEPEAYRDANIQQAVLFTITFCDQQDCQHQ